MSGFLSHASGNMLQNGRAGGQRGQCRRIADFETVVFPFYRSRNKFLRLLIKFFRFLRMLRVGFGGIFRHLCCNQADHAGLHVSCISLGQQLLLLFFA